MNPGDSIGGRYRVVRVLGSGGMGVVLLAHHLRMDREVAIKVLHAADRQSQGLAQRFEREVKALARVQHPHVARALDADVLDDGSPFLVMEYLEGRTLKAELRERGALPPEEAAAYVAQACEGVAAAHAQGILHRDLKPQNLLLTHHGKRRILKVLDFGIAKFMQQETDLTGSGVGIGTPLYMSPEQLSDGASVSFPSDVWALGVVLYELIAGVSPFAADSAGAIVAAVMLEQPVPLERLRPQLPRGLAEAVHRCLSKNASERLPSARALQKLLRAFVVEPDVTSASLKIPVAEPARLPSNHPLAGAIERKVDSFQPASLRAEAPTVLDGARRVPSLATLAQQLQSMRHAESRTSVDQPNVTPPPRFRRRSGVVYGVAALTVSVGALALWTTTRPRGEAPARARALSVDPPRSPTPAAPPELPKTPSAATSSAAVTAENPAPRPKARTVSRVPAVHDKSRASAPLQTGPDGKPLHL